MPAFSYALKFEQNTTKEVYFWHGFSRQWFFSHFGPEDGCSMFFQPFVFTHKAIRYHNPNGHNLDVIKKIWKSDSYQLVLMHWITLVQGLLKYQAENLTFAVSGCFRYQEKNHNSSVIKPKAKSPCQLHRVGGKGVCHWTEQEVFAEYSCLQVCLNFIFFPSSVFRKITRPPKKATCAQTEFLQCVSFTVSRTQTFKVLCSVFLL